MGDTTTGKVVVCILFLCTIQSLMILASDHHPSCRNRLDIVIAVDVTSSLSSTSFEDVKARVKAIASDFTVGPDHTRLALISISNQAKVLANFDHIASIADFNVAVDKLTFNAAKAKLSDGIAVAQNSVLNKARTAKIVKALVLVKDRRLERSAVDSAELSRLASEAAGTKSTGVAIHAVGIGGLWNINELESLFNTEYLLFKNKNVLKSAKSLSNLVCEADCPLNGKTSRKDGLCYEETRHVISSGVKLTTNSAGTSVCRTETDRTFEFCSGHQVCNEADRAVSSCGKDNKVKISTSWQMFDYKMQSCVTLRNEVEADCADAWKCDNQVADIIFLLDKSGSMMGMTNNFIAVKDATLVLAESLNIGPNNVRVGIIKFGDYTEPVVPFGSINDRKSLLDKVKAMGTNIILNELTYTNLGLAEAKWNFDNNARQNVPKFVIVLTDGESSNKHQTKENIKQLKNDGVTIIAVGIAMRSKKELEEMTAPDTSENLFVLNDFGELKSWTDEFTKKLCIRLTPPNPKLCDDKVFTQSVSKCISGQQTVTKTEYKYADANRCIKTYQTIQHTGCKAKCRDPVDGNEYMEGSTWTNVCHEFKCTGSFYKPFLPVLSKCLAADGTCMDIGSPSFRCVNPADGVVTDNCKCIDKNGKAVVAIDTE